MALTKKKNSKAAAPAKKTAAASKPALKTSSRGKTNVTALLDAAPKSALPVKLTPMLATLVDKPFDEAGWLYEVKWDGYRALGFVNKGKVELKSRNDKSFNE